MNILLKIGLVLPLLFNSVSNAEDQSEEFTLPIADGYRGIWYANQASGDEYQFKYSGGLGTYPQQHLPIAIYSDQVKKTFFCYGGRFKNKNSLQHMISYYDHQTGKLARPRILLNKQTDDAHDNPVLQIDKKGFLWIFSNSHGTSRPSFIHRSAKPFEIDRFQQIKKNNFSYGQPWYIKGQGFLFLHTLYKKGVRMLHYSQSPDGINWNDSVPLAGIESGHYQVSWKHKNLIGTTFNYHPRKQGLNWRTNLYYLQTGDGGKTWQTIQGQTVNLPLTQKENPALIAEYQSKKLLVYMKDLNFTNDGRPVILFLTSPGYASGPQNDPRTFHTACWTGKDWDIHSITNGDNNYDYASLYIEKDNLWRIIGTTSSGPQKYNTGGEVEIWTSNDEGHHWNQIRQLTQNSKWNHTYPRKPLNAHPDFYAIWADGHGRKPSASRFYFTNRDGSKIYQMPENIDIEQDADPILIKTVTK